MNSVVNFLKRSDIFYQMAPTQLELVANPCQEVVYQAGEIIFKEKSSSKELYIIAQGEIEILISPGNAGSASESEPDTVITKLRCGQSFGEMAMADEGLRSAYAYAIQKNTCPLVIQRDKLIMLRETYPLLGFRPMHNLAADLAMKIRNTDLEIRDQLL